MNHRQLIFCCAFACGPALPQQASQAQPAAPAASVAADTRCAAAPNAAPSATCSRQEERLALLSDPARLMAAEPTAAGPRDTALTRRQVIAELERARRAGEMDFAAFEAGLDARPR